MSIQFPILNISLSNLSSQDLEETHIGDLWDYPGDNSIFEEYYNNQRYVDQSGHIFKIIGKRKSNFINSIIHFNKKELIFEDCGETLSFSVLKDFLRLSCKSPWIGANQLPKDFGYPEHEERDILYTSYLSSEALHLRVQ